ncbi:MFS transporter [Williamsia sp. MIQD14]|uniref:MFS transporter n=1 Tax=Williamsia sp. MIQD14 TaxID=3425703 RepID=UPI003DA0B73C
MTISSSPETDTPIAEPTPHAGDWHAMRVVATMRGLTFLGDITAATAVELSLQSRGYGGFTIASVLLAATLPPVLLGPISGRVVDRFGKTSVLMTTALFQLVLSAAMLFTSDRFVWTAIIAGLGAGVAFSHPVFGSLPGTLMRSDQQAKAASLSQMSAMAGMLCAPALGALLFGQFGVVAAFGVNTASFAVVVLGAVLLREPVGRASGQRSKTTATSTDLSAEPGRRYRILSDRGLVAVLSANGVLMLGASTINVYIVFLVRDTLGGSATSYGIVGSAWMAGLIPGALLVGRVKASPERLLLASFALVGLGILGAGMSPTVWVLLPFYFIGGLGNGAGATATHVYLNTSVPEEFRGRAFAALGMVSNSGPAFGMLVGGALLSVVTPRTGFLVAAVLVLGTLAVVSSPLLRTAGGSTTRHQQQMSA